MTKVKGLRFAEGLGGMESVTELYVQKDGKEYYVLLTDMGEFQKVHIAEHPMMDEYKRIIRLPNNEFRQEIDKFAASAIYVEDKEMSEWYDIKESPFEAAIKLTAMLSKECPYGDEEVYVKKAKQVIANYLDLDIDNLDLPKTFENLDEFDLYGFEKNGELELYETLEEARQAAIEYQDEANIDISLAHYKETDDDLTFVEEIETLLEKA